MNKIFKYLTLLAFALSVPAVTLTAQEGKTNEKEQATPQKPKERTQPIEFLFDKNVRWKINYPTALYDVRKRRFVPRYADCATIRESRTGELLVYKRERRGSATYELTQKFKEVKKIRWPENDPLLREAQAEIARGNAVGALGIAERFLKFFAPIKAVEGSPWIRAAVVKLDALDLQKNDSALDSFIREIESTPNYNEIEGLEMKIKLARLFQLVRKGENNAVLSTCDNMMYGLSDVETLARLHLVKGDALYNLSRYEDALKTYLRIPVFYGNQAAFMPKAKLAVARCLLRMDKPGMEAMKLALRSEEYLMEVINEYPMAPEAKDAIALLPKHKRDEIAEKGSLEEKAASRAEVTKQIDAENAEIRKAEEEAEAEAKAEEEPDPEDSEPEPDPED